MTDLQTRNGVGSRGRPLLLEALSMALNNALLVAATIFVAAIWLMMFSEVVSRYVTGTSLLITWELSAYCLSWTIFAGAADAASRGFHVSVSVFTERLGASKRAVAVFAFLVATAASLFLLYALLMYAMDLFFRGAVSQTLTRFPVWIIYAVNVVGCGALVLSCIVSLQKLLRGEELLTEQEEGL